MEQPSIKERRKAIGYLLNKYPAAWDWRNMPEDQREALLAEAQEMGLNGREVELRILQRRVVGMIAIERTMADCAIGEG
jgi:hypothetical protein